ncbi:MAG TPA: PA2779 family protein [Burkholderiales bacterium]|nr:PA2779 family protein [Burkholderiales bacterium]
MKCLYKLVSQLLIVSMVLVPFATQAGMIGTDQVVSSAAAQANRDKVVQFVSRADVAKQLEALGVKATDAQARVAAMTQEEINTVAGKIDTLPAGASDSGWWWAAGVLVVALIIWLAYK